MKNGGERVATLGCISYLLGISNFSCSSGFDLSQGKFILRSSDLAKVPFKSF